MISSQYWDDFHPRGVRRAGKGARRGLAGAERRQKNRPRRKQTVAAGSSVPATAVFFVAAYFFAGTLRQPVRAPAPTLRGGLPWDENNPSIWMISS